MRSMHWVLTRPALALERLSSNGAGQMVYQLKTSYRDGTTHFVFERRVIADVTRPHIC